MKVILLENIGKKGSIGDIIDVKRGFARNYLISSNKALYASKENIKQVEKIKAELNSKDQEKKKNEKNMHEEINKKGYLIHKLSTEYNELYGSVKPTEISKLILELDKLEIKPSMIQLAEEIKSLGTFKVKVNLHSDIQSEVNIKVIASDNTE